MLNKLESDEILAKIKQIDYDFKSWFFKLFELRIKYLREENDNAVGDEVIRNQGGIRELVKILRETQGKKRELD